MAFAAKEPSFVICLNDIYGFLYDSSFLLDYYRALIVLAIIKHVLYYAEKIFNEKVKFKAQWGFVVTVERIRRALGAAPSLENSRVCNQ